MRSCWSSWDHNATWASTPPAPTGRWQRKATTMLCGSAQPSAPPVRTARLEQASHIARAMLAVSAHSKAAASSVRARGAFRLVVCGGSRCRIPPCARVPLAILHAVKLAGGGAQRGRICARTQARATLRSTAQSCDVAMGHDAQRETWLVVMARRGRDNGCCQAAVLCLHFGAAKAQTQFLLKTQMDWVCVPAWCTQRNC